MSLFLKLINLDYEIQFLSTKNYLVIFIDRTACCLDFSQSYNINNKFTNKKLDIKIVQKNNYKKTYKKIFKKTLQIKDELTYKFRIINLWIQYNYFKNSK